MLRVSILAMVAATSATLAHAGGIERSAQSVGLLFEEGRAFQLSFGTVSPSLTGTALGQTSGDMAPTYSTTTLGYKMPLAEKLDIAFIYDQSIGADVAYPTGTGYPLEGLNATLDSSEITAFLRYKLNGGFSVYGGLRAQSIEAELDTLLTPAGLYSLSVEKNYELGYAVGAAYERPDIALRIALTYNSAIEHSLDGDEGFAGGGGPASGGGEFTTTIPQSVNLEFQTGIAADTLLFGSVRWQDWSEFDITPFLFTSTLAGASLINYESDYTTYNLGVGRRFSENWSAAITLGYEGATKDIQGNLAPRDGFASIGLAATYRMDTTEITVGARYIDLGNATTQSIGGEFRNNDAMAFGVRMTHRF